MNRRNFLIALAVALPVAVFVPAKIAASWRPVAVGDTTSRTNSSTSIVVGPQVVLIWDEIGKVTPFDLATGKRSSQKIQGVCKDGLATWSHTEGKYPQLLITRNGKTHVYNLPGDISGRLKESSDYAKVLDAPDRIELLYEDRYYRWKPGIAKCQLELRCDEMDFEQADASITHDGQSIVDARNEGYRGTVAWFSTSDGRLARRVATATSARYGADYLSNFGSYSIYTKRVPRSETPQKWEIVDTTNGRVLWSCLRPTEADFLAISPDETRVAISRLFARRWEIRDLRSGKIIRTLPLVPNTHDSAFSPDGATLYSIANGVLYRQRAR